MLDTLIADPGASTSAIVSNASLEDDRCARFLTRGLPEAGDPAELASYLVEELSIGDAEDALSAYKAELADPSSFASEDYEILFESVAAMQRDLTRRKQAHGLS